MFETGSSIPYILKLVEVTSGDSTALPLLSYVRPSEYHARRRDRMTFPQLARFADVAVLLLRLMVGLVFFASGYSDLKDPDARRKDIGMSKGFTIFLGAAEVAGALGVISGVFAQLAAIGLILVSLGAVQKKISVWHTGFWGKSGTNGWSYDTMLIVMNLVIVTTGGGGLILQRLFK
jgi:putative oxidoreductase